MYTKQQRIAEIAAKYPNESIMSLAHHIDIGWLRVAYDTLRKDSVAGVDGIDWHMYGENLEENLLSLHERFKSGLYFAPPVKRVYIPKGIKGDVRPIGMPTLEDKILQKAVKRVLEPIYEHDFLDCSHGYRPDRSPQKVIEEIWKKSMDLDGCWVIEADIRKYFETIDHKYLREFVKSRISDGVINRTIGKWLNAGIMEEELLSYSDSGTPQGGVISPLLSNIYLHVILDMWFEYEIKPHLKAESYLIRYCDDFIILFRNFEDCQRVFKVLPKRFGRYGLTLHPEKTRVVNFQKPQSRERKSETFDFLGFTHYWGKSRKGKFIPKRKTMKAKQAAALRRIYVWCKKNRHIPVAEQNKKLSEKVRGHYAFYGVTFNFIAISRFCLGVKHIWRKWLDRRNRENHMNWEKFSKFLERYPLPKPRIVHSYT